MSNVTFPRALDLSPQACSPHKSSLLSKCYQYPWVAHITLGVTLISAFSPLYHTYTCIIHHHPSAIHASSTYKTHPVSHSSSRPPVLWPQTRLPGCLQCFLQHALGCSPCCHTRPSSHHQSHLKNTVPAANLHTLEIKAPWLWTSMSFMIWILATSVASFPAVCPLASGLQPHQHPSEPSLSPQRFYTCWCISWDGSSFPHGTQVFAQISPLSTGFPGHLLPAPMPTTFITLFTSSPQDLTLRLIPLIPCLFLPLKCKAQGGTVYCRAWHLAGTWGILF